jgi:cell wall-associated NlpC family hydrolase
VRSVGDLSNEPTLNDQIGTLSGDTPLSGDGNGLGELTFDSAGPSSVPTATAQQDPQAKLHMPVLKQNTTTTTSVDGVPTHGGGPGEPDTGMLPENTDTDGLVGYAKKFLGVPYVWGGTSPTGFDCSGFVQYVYAHMGISLPRISADQARAGKRIGVGDLKPGDLVAWDNSSRNNGADHIAIYAGNGMIIEAPRPGRSVQLSHLYDTGEAWGVRLNLGGSKPRKSKSHSINLSASKPRSY